MTEVTEELSSLELARFNEFKTKHKNAKCYYTTNYSLGVGYEIIASILDLTNESNFDLINELNSEIITDELNELENF